MSPIGKLLLSIALLLFLKNYRSSESPKSWSSKIIENDFGMTKSDDSLACKDSTICRAWDDILNVAMCKANKFEEGLNARLKETVSVFYTQTVNKDMREQGWSKFLFNIFKKNDHEDPSNKMTFKAAHLFKVCVPTRRGNLAWLSPYCALDECTEQVPTEKTVCKNQAQADGDIAPPAPTEMRFEELDDDIKLLKESFERRNKVEKDRLVEVFVFFFHIYFIFLKEKGNLVEPNEFGFRVAYAIYTRKT